jgi:pimeloyl-ACP methyl ester carboxylesterase
VETDTTAVRRAEVLVNGSRISYQECGSAAAPAILLVHGLLSDSGTWAEDLEPLAALGLRAIAIDLLGHGYSDKPPGPYLLDDFALLLDRFLEALGLSSATICGHSLGGAIAVHFGYHYPERVDSLVLVSAGGLGREVSPVLRMFALPGAEALTGAVMGRTAVQRLLRSPRVHRVFRVTPQRLVNLRRVGRSLFDPEMREAFFCSLRGVIQPSGQRGSFLEMKYLAEHVPTLLVWSQRDVIIPVAHAHRTHEHLPGSELVVFAGGGHEPHRQNAAEFARAVAAFVLT